MEEQFCNQIRSELIGVHALNSFMMHNSPSRSVMMAGHIASHLVLDNPEPKRTQSGAEHEYGKYTFAVRMPENGRILRVILRYPPGVDKGALHFNPETLVIYENDDTKQLDCFVIPYYSSYHQFFGYKNKLTEATNRLVAGATIQKGTVFADSPGATGNHNYAYGINLNVALASLPAVSEDGIIISRDILERFKFRVYEQRSISVGTKKYPLNLFGNAKEYKPFKDIGEYIRDDGLLMMLRSYDEDLAPVDMGIYDTQEIDYTFDEGLYTREGKGRVVDIKVISNKDPNQLLPPTMTEQLVKYEKALLKYYSEILDFEEKESQTRKKKFGDGRLNMSPRLQRLLVEARAITNHSLQKIKQPLYLLKHREPLDEYTISFVIEYEIVPNIGFKLTGSSGDTSVTN